MKQRGILEIGLLILVPVIISVVSKYVLAFPTSDTVIFIALAFLIMLTIDLHFRLKDIENRLTATTGLIGLLTEAFESIYNELLQMLQKSQKKRIVTEDIYRVFGQPLNKFILGLGKGFLKTILKSSSPKEHEEIRELLEKANRREITREEAERLKRLLEEEKRKRERAGDTLGALVVGLLLLFLLGLLMSLLLKERK